MNDPHVSPPEREPDATPGGVAELLRGLAWLLTLAALPLLLAALDPSVLNDTWVAHLPTFPDGAQRRCFGAGVFVLTVGVITFLGSLLVPRRE